MSALFQQKKITNYVSPEIGIGFGPYGPTLTASGVLSSQNHVILVNSLSVSVQIPFHEIKKEFDWFAFQSGSSADANLGINILAPSKFVLSPNNSQKYNILFVDNDCYAVMKMVLSNILSSWQFWLEKYPANDLPSNFNEFKKLPMTREITSSLESMCYWKAGDYTISITISAKGDIFVTEKTFSLQEDQVRTLKNNAHSIVASLCSYPSIHYDAITVPLM